MILFENYTEIVSRVSRVVWDDEAFVVPWNFGEMTACCLCPLVSFYLDLKSSSRAAHRSNWERMIGCISP
jgi:hypothetical protein